MGNYSKFTIVMKNGIAYNIKVKGDYKIDEFIKEVIYNVNIGKCTTFDLCNKINDVSKVAIFHSEISSIEYD